MKRMKKISAKCIDYLSDYSLDEIRTLINKGYLYACSPREIRNGYSDYVVYLNDARMTVVNWLNVKLIRNLIGK